MYLSKKEMVVFVFTIGLKSITTDELFYTEKFLALVNNFNIYLCLRVNIFC